MRILVTGHTGFKGSWLCLMLNSLGHEVHGISLPPLNNGIFELASVGEMCSSNISLDIRNKEALDQEITRIQPEVVFHLAAQALVLKSYNEIYDTYSINVLGTLNILESALKSNSLKGIIVVTTDKVYKNNGQKIFVETDPLGGKDPYSSSKALADELTQSWSIHNSSIPVGIARAGNVIGGGDVCSNRLIPDIFSALEKNRVPEIRNPKSIRPWQHVIDCLFGYIKLMDYLMIGKSGVFNFGPKLNNFHNVEDVTEYILKHVGVPTWNKINSNQLLEESFLALDSTKANTILGWENKLDFTDGLDYLIEWQNCAKFHFDMQETSLKQIETYYNL